jgi:hypothetical protein
MTPPDPADLVVTVSSLDPAAFDALFGKPFDPPVDPPAAAAPAQARRRKDIEALDAVAAGDPLDLRSQPGWNTVNPLPAAGEVLETTPAECPGPIARRGGRC